MSRREEGGGGAGEDAETQCRLRETAWTRRTQVSWLHEKPFPGGWGVASRERGGHWRGLERRPAWLCTSVATCLKTNCPRMLNSRSLRKFRRSCRRGTMSIIEGGFVVGIKYGELRSIFATFVDGNGNGEQGWWIKGGRAKCRRKGR